MRAPPRQAGWIAYAKAALRMNWLCGLCDENASQTKFESIAREQATTFTLHVRCSPWRDAAHAPIMKTTANNSVNPAAPHNIAGSNTAAAAAPPEHSCACAKPMAQ